MKIKNNIYLVSVLLLLFSAYLYADESPDPNYHYVERCIKISNIDDFPEIALIAYYKSGHGDVLSDSQEYMLRHGIPIIYAVDKSFLNTVGFEQVINLINLDNKNIYNGPYPKPFVSANINIEKSTNIAIENMTGEYIKTDVSINKNKYSAGLNLPQQELFNQKIKAFQIDKEELVYSILGFTDNELIIYKSKRIVKYANGIPDKVETFEKPVVPNLKLKLK